MSEKPDSLLDQEQPELFSSADLPSSLFAAEEQGGEDEEGAPRNPQFTAARFFKLHPERYREIVALLAEDVSHARIVRIFRSAGQRLSRNTVRAIAQRELNSGAVEQVKRKLAGRYQYLSYLCTERAIEKLEDDNQVQDIPLGTLSLSACQFQDKANLLAGEATSRVERIEAPPETAWQELLRQARDREQLSGMSSGGGKSAAKGLAGAPTPGEADLDAAGDR